MKNKILFVASMVAILVIAFTYAFTRAPYAQEVEFFISDVRFAQVPTAIAKIPKAWRFVGVSNGEKLNSNNLWFQDKDGNIYQVSGFTDSKQFVLNERVNKINVGN